MADDSLKKDKSEKNSDDQSSSNNITEPEAINKEEEVFQQTKHEGEIEKEETPPSSVGSSEKTLLTESDVDHSNLHYEDNICIYTDPVSKFQYIWDGNKNEWVPKVTSRSTTENVDSSRREDDSSVLGNETNPTNATVSEKDYEFDGETYTYTDSKTGVKYKYDTAKNSWVVKDDESKKPVASQSDSDEEDEEEGDKVLKQDMTSGYYSFEGDTHLYTDPSDGSVYVWDKEKNAWFPKIDDDFLAHYQMNYGFCNPNQDSEEKKETVPVAEEHAELKRKLPPKQSTWFEIDEQHNTKVYVSNLPLDITEQEFVDLMQKCGLIMRDVDSGKMKVKLYLDPDTNQPKGDALCTYIKIESVDLALKLLDGYDFRGHKISVERAKFQMKGDYNPNLKPKKRRKKDKDKLKKMQEKLFDWRPDKLRGERSKNERVVIIKNLFDPKIFDNDVALILEYRQDLREECSKCGEVRKVVVYDRHAEGVAQVTFRDAEEADLCIKLLNGRFFGQRKITAETWDGKTKYRVAETEEEAQLRLKKWTSFLDAEEKGKKQEPTARRLREEFTLKPNELKTSNSGEKDSRTEHSNFKKLDSSSTKEIEKDSNIGSTVKDKEDVEKSCNVDSTDNKVKVEIEADSTAGSSKKSNEEMEEEIGSSIEEREKDSNIDSTDNNVKN